MKVYFTCSARGTEDYEKNYKEIYDHLEKLGHKHIYHFFKHSDPNEIYSSDHAEKLELYRRSMDSLKNCDILVIEVSTHSLSMGYLLQKALGQGKPTIVLHVEGRRPAFAEGIEDDNLQVIEYSLNNIKSVLASALEFAQSAVDVRFNFFISPAISHYLDWISQNKKTPRSVYLRNMIETDMEQNEEYRESQ